MNTNVLRSVLLTGLVTLASVAQAQNPHGEPWDKWSIGIGGFTSRYDSEIQLNSSALGVGAVIDLEDALNVDSHFGTYRIDGYYRFGKTQRHQVELHYFDSRREGDRVLTEDLQIGDIVFPAGSNVKTDFDLNFTYIDYAYAFLKDERVRLSASAGLHITKIGLRVASTAGKLEDESFTAPLPVVGMRLDVALAKNWMLKTAVSVFYLEYDGFKGGLIDTYFGAEWTPFQHVGFGMGINSVNYDVEGNGTTGGIEYDGSVKFGLTGLLVYARYFF